LWAFNHLVVTRIYNSQIKSQNFSWDGSLQTMWLHIIDKVRYERISVYYRYQQLRIFPECSILSNRVVIVPFNMCKILFSGVKCSVTIRTYVAGDATPNVIDALDCIVKIKLPLLFQLLQIKSTVLFHVFYTLLRCFVFTSTKQALSFLLHLFFPIVPCVLL